MTAIAKMGTKLVTLASSQTRDDGIAFPFSSGCALTEGVWEAAERFFRHPSPFFGHERIGRLHAPMPRRNVTHGDVLEIRHLHHAQLHAVDEKV